MCPVPGTTACLASCRGRRTPVGITAVSIGGARLLRRFSGGGPILPRVNRTTSIILVLVAIAAVGIGGVFAYQNVLRGTRSRRSPCRALRRPARHRAMP